MDVKVPNWSVGVSTCLIREFDPARHLPMVAAHGIAAIELTASHAPKVAADPALAKALGRALADTGIALHSVHVLFSRQLDLSSSSAADRQATLDEAKRSLDLLLSLGGKVLVIHPSSEPIDDDERPERFENARASLAKLAELVPADSAIRIAVENLPRTCLCHDSAEHGALLDALANPVFGVCLDVNHGNLRENLDTATKQYGHRLFSLHISDNDGIDERHWLPGKGIIDWDSWMQALAGTGYRGPIMYEVSPWIDGSEAVDIDTMLAGLRENARTVLGV